MTNDRQKLSQESASSDPGPYLLKRLRMAQILFVNVKVKIVHIFPIARYHIYSRE